MQWLRQLPYELLLGWRYTRAGRSSRRNGFISFISGVSMLGIALGVATLIIVLSVINGFQKEVRDRMLGVLAHAEVYASDGQPLPDAQALMARVRQVPDVRGVAPFVAMQALMTRGEDMRGVMLRGVDPALESSVSDIFKGAQGAALARLQPGEFGVLLGVDLARNLNVQLADTVTLMTPNGQMSPAGAVPRIKQLRVVGFFNSGHYEFDANMALVHIDDAARLARQEGPSGLRLQLKDMHQAPAVALDLNMALGAEYFVRDWTRSNRTWFAAVQVEKRMLFIILTLIVAVAAFNLVSTLVMTVTEKRADIAILRTLGASPRSIMGIFVVQGAAVGFMGTFIGLGLGLLVAFNIDVIVPAIEQLLGVSFLPKEIYLINAMPSDPQAADIVPITLFSLLMAFVATLYPSWQASRLNPAEALRYE